MARHIWADGDALTSTRLNALPGGVVGYVNGSGSDQTAITTDTDITGLSVAWTAESSRLYRTTVTVGVQQVSNAGTITISIANASNTIVRRRTVSLAAGGYAEVTVVLLETGVSGSTTRKARAFSTASSLSVLGASVHNASIVVEDLGVA
jgi:hypothetical protein